jgi:hypothetical protein
MAKDSGNFTLLGTGKSRRLHMFFR